jgi:hypothetical protein
MADVNFLVWRRRHFGEFRRDCARYLDVSRTWRWLLERGWLEPSRRVRRLMRLPEDDPVSHALESTLERLRRGKGTSDDVPLPTKACSSRAIPGGSWGRRRGVGTRSRQRKIVCRACYMIAEAARFAGSSS